MEEELRKQQEEMARRLREEQDLIEAQRMKALLELEDQKKKNLEEQSMMLERKEIMEKLA